MTSRYGTPAQFAGFVNACHRMGIGVIMDFVPVHFAANADALAKFDGTYLYEYDSDVGQSEWGTCNFNYYRREVCSFLSSAAGLWMDVYHCDGIRMDAISRALYWQGDPNRGVNQGAVNFLRSLNHGLNERWPTGIYMAEDSTNFLKVTAPTRYEGVGFDYKWDMGWMHDTLDYFATPFGERPGCYGKLLFSMHYFYNELYLLALSHDEVVHGKKTIIDKLSSQHSFSLYLFESNINRLKQFLLIRPIHFLYAFSQNNIWILDVLLSDIYHLHPVLHMDLSTHYILPLYNYRDLIQFLLYPPIQGFPHTFSHNPITDPSDNLHQEVHCQ